MSKTGIIDCVAIRHTELQSHAAGEPIMFHFVPRGSSPVRVLEVKGNMPYLFGESYRTSIFSCQFQALHGRRKAETPPVFGAELCLERG